jgi:hypothetical protein
VFGFTSVNFLGHFYLSKKHGSLPNTLLDIKFPCPLIVKELQVHLGMVNFYLCVSCGTSDMVHGGHVETDLGLRATQATTGLGNSTLKPKPRGEPQFLSGCFTKTCGCLFSTTPAVMGCMLLLEFFSRKLDPVQIKYSFMETVWCMNKST